MQHSLIGVKASPIPMKYDDVLRDRIDESLKFLSRLLAILDVNHGGDPRRLATSQRPVVCPS
jgi:hypothetical protein